MFTGIIEEIGTIKSIKFGVNSAILNIAAEYILSDVSKGDSIAVNGVCLTVTDFTNKSFEADVMHETLNRSSLAALKNGSKVNLERAMSAAGRFGGHIVSGHVDGIGTICGMKQDDNAWIYRISAEASVLRYIVEKGSVAVDGISLTVASVTDKEFVVSVIPHTSKATILSLKKPGDIVNIENDIIGKYVEKLIKNDRTDTDMSLMSGYRALGGVKPDNKGITREFLIENGF